MPYTVAVSFTKFIENISLTGDHKDTAEARRKRLVGLLESDFRILDSFPAGSIPKGTALKAHADLDVIVVLHFGTHIKDKTPSQVLQAVRDVLGEYKTGVRKNGQAVTLSYTSWPSVDIVPVARVDNDGGGVAYYYVPNMNTETWIQSRPRLHAKTVAAKAETCGYRFLPLVRMLKQWNRAHSELMSSYHIEVLALSAFDSTIDDYPWAVYQFFERAVALAARSLPYAGAYADDYLDAATRRQVVQRLQVAKDRARNAWYRTYGTNADDEGAIEIWRHIFGDKFPAYG